MDKVEGAVPPKCADQRPALDANTGRPSEIMDCRSEERIRTWALEVTEDVHVNIVPASQPLD
jgi:hypothetical protein